MCVLTDLVNELDENINLDLDGKYEKDFALLRNKVIGLEAYKEKIKEIQKVIDKFNDNDALPCEQWVLEIQTILGD